MKKIIIRIGAGLGNQLFKYAAARQLSIKLKRSLVIDYKSEFKRDFLYERNYQLERLNINGKKADYFELLYPFPRLSRYIKVKYNRLLPLNQKDYIIEENHLFYKKLNKLNKLNTKRKKIYLEGAFQNENYFKNISKIIKKDFQIKSPIDNYNLKFKKIIKRKKNSICLHVRNHPHIKLEQRMFDYYSRAILIMKKKFKNHFFFIFSDFSKKEIERFPFMKDLNKKNYFVVKHNSNSEVHLDLWLMTKCNHFIIAHSTLSWWAAYLAPNKKKKIIGPASKRWKNIKYHGWWHKEIMPKNWKQV